MVAQDRIVSVLFTDQMYKQHWYLKGDIERIANIINRPERGSLNDALQCLPY